MPFTSDLGGQVMILRKTFRASDETVLMGSSMGLDFGQDWVVRRAWVIVRDVFTGSDGSHLQVGNAVDPGGYLSVAVADMDDAANCNKVIPALHSGLGDFLQAAGIPQLYICGQDTSPPADRRNIAVTWDKPPNGAGMCDVYVEVMHLAATAPTPS